MLFHNKHHDKDSGAAVIYIDKMVDGLAVGEGTFESFVKTAKAFLCHIDLVASISVSVIGGVGIPSGVRL